MGFVTPGFIVPPPYNPFFPMKQSESVQNDCDIEDVYIDIAYYTKHRENTTVMGKEYFLDDLEFHNRLVKVHQELDEASRGQFSPTEKKYVRITSIKSELLGRTCLKILLLPEHLQSVIESY